LIVLGKAFVLPSSDTYGDGVPLNGSMRYNPLNSDFEGCVDGVWTTIGAGAGGGGGPIGIADVAGLQAALNAKSPTVHMHGINEVTGLQVILDGKAPNNHGHSLDSIPNLVPTLTSLQNQINTKVGAVHFHPIGQVTGLQAALDQRALAGHVHDRSEVTGLLLELNELRIEKLGFALPGSPPTGYTFSWIAGIDTQFADEMGGSFGSVDVNPGGATVGNIIIGTNGVFTFQTTFTGMLVQAGEKLTFVCPVKDTAISNIAITLVGTKA
jgi:hypothetical protein